MSEVLVAVLSGVMIFSIGQAVVKWVIDPVQEQRRIVGRVAHALVYRAGAYWNPDNLTNQEQVEIHRELIGLAGELRAATGLIPLYFPLQLLGVIRPKSSIQRSTASLIGLANNLTMRPEIRMDTTWILEQETTVKRELQFE